jgi:hypothetical protein
LKGQKHTFVGNFFEEVALRILGGDLTRNDDGDINIWRSETTVEVKSSGHLSSYGFRLCVEQIDWYNNISQFPFSRAWYVFFNYRNGSRKTEGGKRVSELSVHNDPLSVNKYLASSVIWCTILDLSIVNRWKELLPHSTKSVMGHPGKETVNLKPTSVHHIANGGFAHGLRELNLNPDDFNKVTGHIEMRLQPDLFSEYDMSFPVTAVLPKEESRSFQNILKHRGFPLERVAS